MDTDGDQVLGTDIDIDGTNAMSAYLRHAVLPRQCATGAVVMRLMITLFGADRGVVRGRVLVRQLVKVMSARNGEGMRDEAHLHRDQGLKAQIIEGKEVCRTNTVGKTVNWVIPMDAWELELVGGARALAATMLCTKDVEP